MNVLDAIGGTSLVELRRVVPAGCADVFVKLEWENLTGSMKDHIALAVIASADNDGRLRPGDTVVEYTGGRTGTSLALVCAAKGYRIQIVTSDAFGAEKRDHMLALGAELTLVPSEGGLTTKKLIRDMIEEARRRADRPRTFWTNQLDNRDAIAGYHPLGEQVWGQTSGAVDAFVHSVDAAASSRNVASVLKSKGRPVEVVCVEPAESAVLAGGVPGPHKIEGVGIGYRPPPWEPSLVDGLVAVPTADAKAMTRRLAREEALFNGTSSGANVLAAIEVGMRLGPGKKVDGRLGPEVPERRRLQGAPMSPLADAAWAALGASPPAGLHAELAARYAEPHRAYHTLRHLEECFTALGPAAHLAEHLPEIQLALWFHDAVYDTHAGDSEERSARWAEGALAAASAPIAARVRDLVLATKHAAAPGSPDAEVLVDVDLSILGADEARFSEYEAQVRREYAWVPDEAFRAGRARVVKGLLERPRIYATEWFYRRLEERARENSRGRRLRSPSVPAAPARAERGHRDDRGRQAERCERATCAGGAPPAAVPVAVAVAVPTPAAARSPAVVVVVAAAIVVVVAVVVAVSDARLQADVEAVVLGARSTLEHAGAVAIAVVALEAAILREGFGGTEDGGEREGRCEGGSANEIERHG